MSADTKWERINEPTQQSEPRPQIYDPVELFQSFSPIQATLAEPLDIVEQRWPLPMCLTQIPHLQNCECYKMLVVYPTKFWGGCYIAINIWSKGKQYFMSESPWSQSKVYNLRLGIFFVPLYITPPWKQQQQQQQRPKTHTLFFCCIEISLSLFYWSSALYSPKSPGLSLVKHVDFA